MKNLSIQHLFLTLLAVSLLTVCGQAQFTLLYHLEGDLPFDNLGRSVSGAGDVNGDGVNDFIVGASSVGTNGPQSGSVSVYSGSDGTLLHTFNGDSAGDFFGLSTSGAGDVNGDGFDDLIVGAFRDDTFGADSGNARVFSGFDGSVLYNFFGDSAGDFLGNSVSGAGDVNGDGFADLIVGSQNDDPNGMNSGSAFVYSGADGSTLYSLSGSLPFDAFGFSVSGAGDVNGDGFADVIVGAIDADVSGVDKGRAFVFSGADGQILYTLDGSNLQDRFGISVKDAGDVNGDGFADVIVGAHLADTFGADSGSARVVSGIDGATLHTLNGTAAGDEFGFSVSGAGDTNGDGFDDLIVGSHFNDIAGFNAGRVRVFSGLDGTVLSTMTGAQPGERFGFSVNRLGDMDNDGLSDVIVGSPFIGGIGMASGGARVYLADNLGVTRYETFSDKTHFLDLEWLPTGNLPQATTGVMKCSGAGPGWLGLVAASLIPDDTLIGGFLPLLLNAQAANVLLTENFAFNFAGELLTTVSRKNGFLAGLFVYVQCFAVSPLALSSNGLRFEIVP